MNVVAPREERKERGGLEVVRSDAPGSSFPFTADPMVPVEPTRPGWRWHRLLTLARLATGHTPSRRCPEYWNGDIPWLQLPDIRALDGRRALDTLEHTNELGIKNSAAVLLPEGTVCLSRTASVGFVTVMGRPMATSQDFVNWVCGPDLSPEFLKWLFIACRKPIRDLGSGAVHQTIYFPTVEQFAVCIPPLAEQERIAGRLTEQLGAVERARAAAAQRLAAAEALPAALLREVFDGPQASGWETHVLGDLVRTPLRTGISKPGRPDSDKRCLTLSAVRGRTLLLDASKPAEVSDADAEGAWLRPGCFYVVRGNGNRELVGRGAFAPDPMPRPVLFPDLLFQIDLGEHVDPSFFWCLWTSATVRREIEERARTAAGIYKINTGNLNTLPLRLPDLPTQRRLAADLGEKLAAAEGVIARCREELAAIEALPAALLRDAFGGGREDEEQEAP